MDADLQLGARAYGLGPLDRHTCYCSAACVLWTQGGCCFIDSSTDVQLPLRKKTQILRKASVNNS